MATDAEQALISLMAAYTNDMRDLLDRIQIDESYPRAYQQQDCAMIVSEIERANGNLMRVVEREHGQAERKPGEAARQG